MRYAKLITAGMLVLTVAALNDFQETVILRIESFIQMSPEVMEGNLVAVLLAPKAAPAGREDVAACPKVHVASNPHWKESILFGMNKYVYLAISKLHFWDLYESYSLIARLVLSKPVFPLTGS